MKKVFYLNSSEAYLFFELAQVDFPEFCVMKCTDCFLRLQLGIFEITPLKFLELFCVSFQLHVQFEIDHSSHPMNCF